MSNHRKRHPFKRQAIPPGANVLTNINPANCIQMVCSVCGSEIFADAKRLHFVSALQNPIGKEGIGFTPAGYICAGCGSVNTITKKGQEHGREFPDRFTEPEDRGDKGLRFGASGYGRTESTPSPSVDGTGDEQDSGSSEEDGGDHGDPYP